MSVLSASFIRDRHKNREERMQALGGPTYDLKQRTLLLTCHCQPDSKGICFHLIDPLPAELNPDKKLSRDQM